MGTISLTSYEAEIDQFLEQKKYDDAIAHCNHILQSFPRDVNVLRLLGKAFLEKQQYSEACQDFLRVLSVIPTDFIAHIGMSVIREDEKHIDAAIWHMERAFEQQPVNPAIQDELRRLYSLKTLDEPVRMSLSRAALVRMYTRGKLLPQAIAEAEASLNEEPGRLDLQTTLAQLYFSTGMTEKSTTLSEIILKTLPYNLTANQVMSTYLTDAGRHEEAGVYTQRCSDLDPGSNLQKKDGKPGEGGIAKPVSIERLDDLSSHLIGEKTTALRKLLDELIPVDCIENWLNSVVNYQKLMEPLPSEGSDTVENLEQELPLPIELPVEVGDYSPTEIGNNNTEDMPGFEDKELSTHNEIEETEGFSEGKLKSGIAEPMMSGLFAQSPDQTSLDHTEEPVLLPEPILGETAGEETDSVAVEKNPLDGLEHPVSVIEEIYRDFEESLNLHRLDEDGETPPLHVEVGDGITKSEDDPKISEQEPLTAKAEEVLQEYDDAVESAEPIAPLQELNTSGEAALDNVNIADGLIIESTNLSDGWIPIANPSTEAEEKVLAASMDIQEMPEDDLVKGQTSFADQGQPEPEDIIVKETTPEINPAEDAILSQELEEEITKPMQIPPQDSSGEGPAEIQPETSNKVGEILDPEAVKMDTQVGPGDQFEEEASEKKHGFLAWLKSVKSVVQEEIKEPKLPAWMQTGKPTERIKVPEISDLIDIVPGKQEETVSLSELPHSFPAVEIPDEDQEIPVHEEEDQTSKIEAEREQLSPSDTQEEEVWEVGYQAKEIGDEVEQVVMEQPRYLEDLERARIELNQGNILKAAERYKKIIKRGININNVILSLEEAVKNNPGELKLFQTLGDAYVRAGRLQDALDAYTKAEELLK